MLPSNHVLSSIWPILWVSETKNEISLRKFRIISSPGSSDTQTIQRCPVGFLEFLVCKSCWCLLRSLNIKTDEEPVHRLHLNSKTTCRKFQLGKKRKMISQVRPTSWTFFCLVEMEKVFKCWTFKKVDVYQNTIQHLSRTAVTFSESKPQKRNQNRLDSLFISKTDVCFLRLPGRGLQCLTQTQLDSFWVQFQKKASHVDRVLSSQIRTRSTFYSK